MMVWIYIDTNKQVGDVDHLKVFATPEAADEWFKDVALYRGLNCTTARAVRRSAADSENEVVGRA